ncbi:helix-turn-helix domain-containing protein [Alicyclobacillus fastidiosus]|uniref:Helix-turn-helix domain-containing protein n=1 Tax=Alicyclobacillus fastidiosus TaxID=392011 RepID=A0ABY6ZEK7_9BACL|nr:hypothetical protein [Alicyclobacillus fastidiosus]WAH41329.1 helix-turn-helix domain-containing protein [Alicyclobacillus fastidiosus]GMA62939.1 hypothetical protein GCM10025859_33790 [Alicyclobacillus fastidiosus]
MTNKPTWSPMDWQPDDEWISVVDVMKHLKCSRATGHRWCEEGKLPTMQGP